MTTVSDLKSRIELYRLQLTPDGQGGYDETYVRVGTVWAQIHRPRFWETETGGGPATAITQGITIRYRKEVASDWRVRYQHTEYRVLHIEYGEKRDVMTLTCTAVSHHG